MRNSIILLTMLTLTTSAQAMPSCQILNEIPVTRMPDEQAIEQLLGTPIGSLEKTDVAALRDALASCRAADGSFQQISDEQFFQENMERFISEIEALRIDRAQEAAIARSAAMLRDEATNLAAKAMKGPLSEAQVQRVQEILAEVRTIKSGVAPELYVRELEDAFSSAESALTAHKGHQIRTEFETSVEASKLETERLAQKAADQTRIVIGLAEAARRAEIEDIGLPPQLLTVHVKLWDWFRRPDGSLAPYDWGTLKIWLALLLESGQFSEPRLAKADGATGVSVQYLNHGTLTVLFEMRDGNLYLSHIGKMGRQPQRLFEYEEVPAAQELSSIGHKAVATLLQRLDENPPLVRAPEQAEPTDKVFGFEGRYRNAQNGTTCIAEGDSANVIQLGSGRIVRSGNETAMLNIAPKGGGWSFDIAMELPTGDVAELKGELEPISTGLQMTVWSENTGQATVVYLVSCE